MEKRPSPEVRAHVLLLIQPRLTTWLCLIADHNVKGNYKKRLKLAEGQIVIHLPLTWKGRVKNNGPGGKPVYRRGWAFTTRALYHDPQCHV